MPEAIRPNPDSLLSSIQREEAAGQRGRLKVFLGMAPGVGKTFAMLESARREFASGRDVVIGYVETHGRKETDALTEGLPVIPRVVVQYRGVALAETNLDAILARKPQLVLMDELAHTNAPGSRHPKRHQDVVELIEAGIDVFTTLNIQHVESRAEAVRQITNVSIQETVPDTALDHAELELVDLPPDELRARLAGGKVYVPERIRDAEENFFRPGNLSALRELALRFAAEHVGQDVLEYRQALGIGDPWKSGQRLLVALSASPTSAALLRWTRRLAGELQAPWLAVYIELPRSLAEDDQARLAKHLALARELGAQVVTTTEDDLVRGLVRVAREHNATQLVVGKPAGWRAMDYFRGSSQLHRLIRESGNIDVHVIRAEGEPSRIRRPLSPRFEAGDWRGHAVALSVVACVTAVNALLQRWLGYQSLALNYLLSVVLLAMFVGRGATLAAATATALLWNFLFVPPVLTLHIGGATDVIFFFTYFVVALAMGQLTARVRAQQMAERRREERATALYLLTRELAKAPDLVELLAVVVREIGKAVQADVAISLPEKAEAPTIVPYFAGTWPLSEKEQSVAAWAFAHRQPAGRGTGTLPSSEGLHLPLVAGESALGVLSLRFCDFKPPPPAQLDLLDAFVAQIALVLDRQRLRDEEHEAQLLAASERLTKTLLNSLSHELRTPISAITTAANGLAEDTDGQPGFQRAMVGEIREAAARLNRLVGNVLDTTRLELGHVTPRLDWCDVSDLVNASLREAAKDLARRKVTVDIAPKLPLLRIDSVLMQQALTNLLLNAARHTPADTAIHVSARAEDSEVVLAVADRGPGVAPEVLPRLFHKFYRAPNAPAGGIGLGLSIVKGFVEAQGGRVHVENRADGGSVFTIRLPAGKAPPIPAEGTP